MQNLECDVLPPGINSAKIPRDATIITISPFDLKATEIALQINVCLFPHNYKEKNTMLVFIYSCDNSSIHFVLIISVIVDIQLKIHTSMLKCMFCYCFQMIINKFKRVFVLSILNFIGGLKIEGSINM